MYGVLPYYYDFANYFKNGFAYKEGFTANIYTWPMWGYGLVLLLGKKIYIIIFQQLFTILTIFTLRKNLKNILTFRRFRYFNLLLFFALPWFFFHTSLWPYSVSANLFTLSIFFLGLGWKNNNVTLVAKAAFLFGIMLNFRSDYYFLAIIFSVLQLAISIYKRSKIGICMTILWVFIINITLVPWFLYTKKYSETGSFVSTNSGHVFFISLGQLPNNKWKITTSDGDSVMYSIIQKKIGIGEHSLTLKSNILLMQEFKKLISKDPYEYIKKCIHNAKSFFIMPFYIGDFHKDLKNSTNFTFVKNEIKNNNFILAARLLYNNWRIEYSIAFFLYIIGLIVMILFIFNSSYFFIELFSFKKLDYISLFIFITTLYQFSLNVFAYNLPIYTTNIFILCILFIVINKKGNQKLINSVK